MEELAELQVLLARIDERQQSSDKKLEQILVQTTKTNGRVTDLEVDVREIENDLSVHKEIKHDVKELQDAVTKIEAKNVEQDIVIKSKKNVWTQVLEWIKWAALAFLVVKGVFGVDTLLGGKLF